MTLQQLQEELLDEYDAEVMDWFYETVKINFGVDMAQDSTDLRTILQALITQTAEATYRECAEIAQNMESDTSRILGSMECSSPHTEDVAKVLRDRANSLTKNNENINTN